MDLMNRVFLNYLDLFIIVFIIYIFLYSQIEDEHMNHLRLVLQVFKEHQLFAKYSKCKILLRLIDFLGHIVSTVGIEVDQKKTKARLRIGLDLKLQLIFNVSLV